MILVYIMTIDKEILKACTYGFSLEQISEITELDIEKIRKIIVENSEYFEGIEVIDDDIN